MKPVCATLAAAFFALLGLAVAAPARAADEAAAPPAEALSADVAFREVVGNGQGAALVDLLDAGFTWTDADGNTLTRAQVLKTVPQPAIGDESLTLVNRYGYGDVAVFEANLAKMHVLRVWVKRPAGWKALVYQEVRSLDAPLSFTPGAGTDCQNPCKTIKYTPKNDAERGVVTAYTSLESSAVAKNVDGWGAVTAKEFVAASSNSTELLDRATRMAQLAQKNMVGLSPTPLVSAEMFDFSGAIIMRSQHKPDRGDPLHVTRVFIQRDGKWLATLSYQTAVPPASH